MTKRRHSIIKRFFLYSIVLTILVYSYSRSFAVSAIKSKIIDYASKLEVKQGDFIFQHLPGKLTDIIKDITNSPYSHCGIVIKKDNTFYVLEAIGPVKETPLNVWVSRGYAQRVTLIRFKDEYQRDIPKIIAAAYQFKGLPYDSRFQWDDQKIYCSELIYKAVDLATGIKISEFKRLKDLNWKPYEKYIRYLEGGEVPLNRKMIIPADIVRSDKFNVVYSNFSKK